MGNKRGTFFGMSDQTEPKRRVGRPATGVTPKRNIRVGEIWDEAAERALAEGENMAGLVTRLLHRYVEEKRKRKAA